MTHFENSTRNGLASTDLDLSTSASDVARPAAGPTRLVSAQRPGGFRALALPATITDVSDFAFGPQGTAPMDVVLLGQVPSFAQDVVRTADNRLYVVQNSLQSQSESTAGWDCIFAQANMYAAYTMGSHVYSTMQSNATVMSTRRTIPTMTYVFSLDDTITSLVIPRTIVVGGTTYAVTGVARSAGAGLENLEIVFIPNTVTHIEAGAFAGLQNAVVVFEGEIPDIGAGGFGADANVTAVFDENIVSPEDVADMRTFFTRVETVSGVCLRGDTVIETDQGAIPIRDMVAGVHTIGGRAVRGISRTRERRDTVVQISAGALGKDMPHTDIVCSRTHRVKFGKSMFCAHELVDVVRGVVAIPYDGCTLYNVLLDKHSTMRANGLVVETLHPRSRAAHVCLALSTSSKSRSVSKSSKSRSVSKSSKSRSGRTSVNFFQTMHPPQTLCTLTM